MLSPSSRQLIAFFFTAYRGRSALLVGLLGLAGLAEALGVATLLPLLDAVGGTEGGERSAAGAAVERLLNAFGAEPTLPTLLVLIVLAMFLKAGFRLLAMQQVGYTVAHVATDLRLRLLRALTVTSWPYFVGQRVGRFSNAVGGEAGRAANAYRSACALFAAFVQVLVYTTVAMLVSWQVAVLGIAAGGLMIMLLSRAVQMSRDAGQRQNLALRTLSSRLTDALSGIKAIKAMGREEHLQPLLEHETEALRAAQKKQVLAGELLISAQEPMLALLLAVGIYVGTTTFDLPVGYVFMLGFLFYRLAGRISTMQVEYQAIAGGEAAFASLQEVTDAAWEARESTSGRHSPRLEREIVFDNVSFSHGEKEVLINADLRIAAGEFVTIVGASGAGKTTAIDLLVGFFNPAGGRVQIDDVPLQDMNLRAWRQFVGYVPQETFLFHDSLRENVTLGDPSLTDEDVLRALRLAGAEAVVEALPNGILTPLGERGSKLSGGQRQRVGLARALVRTPVLLILDEVTSALDLETELGICETLSQLPGQVTIIAISHRPGFVDRADRIVKLHDGRFYEVDLEERVQLGGAYHAV
jgi:ATP-binding cassette, subfamily C, bacterial